MSRAQFIRTWGEPRCLTCPPDDVCQATQKPCPLDTADAFAQLFPIYFGVDWGSEPGFTVPNRLYGATVNREGDAV